MGTSDHPKVKIKSTILDYEYNYKDKIGNLSGKATDNIIPGIFKMSHGKTILYYKIIWCVSHAYNKNKKDYYVKQDQQIVMTSKLPNDH